MKQWIFGIILFLLVTQPCAQSLTDIDVDDDGLIEIHNLEMLDAMRYQVDGSGYREDVDAVKITAGCAVGGCTGYELMRDLDFMDDASYVSTANKVRWSLAWQPIGTIGDAFNTTFEGNGHTLSNLRINRSAADYIGLFGLTGSSAALVNLGLLTSHVQGRNHVGGLVGWNNGSITNSYATSSVAGENNVGGLVGVNWESGSITSSYATGSVAGENNVGGLVGVNWESGSITNSYATGSVAGENEVGGLVGENHSGSSITNSYATGSVAGENEVGGLVGFNSSGSITNSYATGSVEGGGDVGGLVGFNSSGSITNSYATGSVEGGGDVGGVGGLVGVNWGSTTNSYWDVQTSGIAVSAGGTSKTTIELQSPTTATGIYSDWSTADWDFSDPSHYPLLKYAVGTDTDNPACSVSGRPVCGTRLPDQFPERSLLEDLVVVDGTLSPPFNPRLFAYDAMVTVDATHLELHTTASEASLHIRSDAADTEVHSTETASVVFALKPIGDTVIRITVMEDRKMPTEYRLTVSYTVPPTPVIEGGSAQPLDEGATVALRVADDYPCDSDIVLCEWSYRDAVKEIELAETELSADLLQLIFTVPTDYVEPGQTTRQLIVSFTVRGRGLVLSAETALVIMGQNNGSINEGTVDLPTLVDRTFNAPVIDLAADPDGVNADPELRYQWQRVKSVVVDLDEPANWEDIDGATAMTYTLTALSYISPHRVRVRYTDAQGYENTIYTQWFIDIDADDDGLIEIMYLEEVDAMRYQLDGSAYTTRTGATKITTGCADGGCTGYELLRDLDFMDDASYVSTANKTLWTVADYADREDTGWQPIGTYDDVFGAIFEGNGHTLSNLMLNRPAADYVGLFGYTGSSATLVNLGLLNLSVRGNHHVGGLVGGNQARIANSYAVGTIVGASDNAGGLVGVNDKGTIANSYAMGTLAASAKAGGLVGLNVNSTITNSYATGIIQGDQFVGGLVGVNDQSSIANSYAIGTVIGVGNDAGGLVAQNTEGRITSSYWDVQTSGIAVSAAGTSKTTLDLQSPTAATGIYSDWSTTDWDFSNPLQYPLIQYATTPNLSYAACGLSGQPVCGTQLPDQFPERSLLEDLVVVDGTLSPPFNPRLFAYDAMISFDATHLELQITAIGASLRIHSDASDTELRSTDTASVAIQLNKEDDTVIRIEAVKGEYRAEIYRLTVPSVAKPSTPVLVVDSSQAITEGGTAVVRATNAYRCGVDLSCRWSYRDAMARTIELAELELSTDSLQLIFTVPTDYVEPSQTTRSLIVSFTASNRSGVASAEATLVIMEQDNGPIDEETVDPPILIGRILNTPVIDLAADPDGVNANPELRYQWQRAESVVVDLGDPDNWEDIDAATAATYTLTALSYISPHRVRVRYTDAQGYENTIYTQWFIDIDADDNGLIEIMYMEEIDAMRHQLDGSGYTTSTGAAKITTGCAVGGCKGYELMRDLDFMSDSSYISTANKTLWTVADYTNREDAGWQPIGTIGDAFNTTFEGNGHTLSNLMLNRPAADYVGLFGYTGSSATLVNLGLLNLSVRGNNYVGGLVGRSMGAITNSYAMGTVTGTGDEVGGLVGRSMGAITNSYAMGTVTGTGDEVGGLVGRSMGAITNSYATATVTGTDRVGGLVGYASTITNSYATGTVTGTGDEVGGLVGGPVDRVTGSYWDVQTSGIAVSAGGTSKTTIDLQSPTTATGIYSGWSTADWDFSSPLHYPLLKYAAGTDTDNPTCGVSGQPVCGEPLPSQISLLEVLMVANGTVSPPFAPEIFAYNATVAFDATHIELHTTASGASLHIRSDASDTEVRGTETASAVLTLKPIGDTVIRITVMEGRKMPTEYRLTVSYVIEDSVAKPPTPVLVVDSAQPITEGSTVTVRATNDYSCDSGLMLCEWSYRDAMALTIELAEIELSTDSQQLSFTVPTDYVEPDQMTRPLIVSFTASNRSGVASAEAMLVITEQDNGPIDEETVDPPILIGRILNTPVIDLAADPDGVNANPELRYQWQRAESVVVDLGDPDNWEDIDAATAATYTLTTVSYIPPHRVQVRYTDAQGYENTIYTQWFIDIDADDDGLIEIIYMEEVDAMRYQLDGSGYLSSADATKITTGCADGGCKGYELMRDLDFMSDSSYISAANKTLWTVADYTNREDAGWQPIGTYDDVFNAIFEGNGHTLSNLMLNRSAADYVGLFGYTGSSATLVNLGLLNLSVRGNNYVGGLVGGNQARIANSYAVGTIVGAGDNAGGLVGVNDNGTIANSYAMGALTALAKAGGLVGWNANSTITNSYATGIIQGEQFVGGLVGVNDQSAIANSYAIGTVIGAGDDAGGLVAQDTEGRITSSYWDVQTSGIAVSAGGTSKTTLDLQSPTAATGIYSEWSTTDWDFGDPSQYPLLKYATAPNLSYAACDLSGQVVCGTRLSEQFPERGLLEDLVVVDGTLSPPFNSRLFAYDAIVAVDATHLELQTTAIGASLRIHSDALDTEVRSTDTASVSIRLNEEDDTVVRIEVVKGAYRTEMYRLTVPSVAKPSTPVIVVDSVQPITEGSAVTVRIANNYSCDSALTLCEWSYRDATARTIELADTELSTDLLQLSFTVPTDYVAASQTSRQLVVVFMSRNRGGLVSVVTPLVIMKEDNGTISGEDIDLPILRERTLTAPEIDLATDPDGVNANPELSYRWQRVQNGAADLSDPSSWEDIDGATSKTYTLTDRHFTPHRVQLSYLDGQAYNSIVHTQWIGVRDIDRDDDGLIEIHNFEMLNAIRYQLDGSGYYEGFGATKITTGCAVGGCKGYELIRDLDFMDDASYASTANKVRWSVAWPTIGPTISFNAIFEGNGHTLSNLRIYYFNARSLGLFGSTGGNAAIANLGLLNSHVSGHDFMGSLVGENEGRITNSYAIGTVIGQDDNVGVLVGWNGGHITNSYAAGIVMKRLGLLGKSNNIGGLVGWNEGSIANSYATVTVRGDHDTGGLVGWSRGSITNSYATGIVQGDLNVGGNVGGLIGKGSGSVTGSYWDVQTSGIAVSAGGTSKTTIELQSPTTATGIYSGWSTADWDFSSPPHYPLLKYAVGTDTDNPACGGSEHPACGERLPSQISLLEALTVANGTVSPPFAPEIFAYNVAVAFDATDLELHTTASGASLHIRSDAADTEVRGTETANGVLTLKPIGDTVIRITVMEGRKMPTEYRLTVSYDIDDSVAKPSTPVIVVDLSQLIVEGSTVTARVINDYSCDSGLMLCEWSYRDAMAHTIELVETKLSTDSQQLSFIVPTDYVEPGQTTRQLIVSFTANNRSGVANAEIVLVIWDQDNSSIDEGTVGPPTLVGRTFNVPVIDLAADPDGVNANPELRNQWQRAESIVVDLDEPANWEDIDAATATTYTLTALSYIPPHRVRVRYIDARGFENTIYTQWLVDIDADDDGLIEIMYLEEVDAMRYQPDGSGYTISTAATKVTTGCTDGGCTGYELLRDLDFMSDASYVSTENKMLWTVADYTNSEDTGWQPIGTYDDVFDATFEGNGHTFSNLRINRSAASGVGLFGYTGSSATLVNLGLLNLSVRGNNEVGGLVGRSMGAITNSYAMGTVTGTGDEVGGLAGYASTIINSYATAAVTGTDRVGGLAGYASTIINSYATAAVTGTDRVGGLAGYASTITNSYATGTVTGTGDEVGGLVGASADSVTASYWDVQTSGIEVSTGGAGMTTVELQSPTTATGIYSGWSTADWDFSSLPHYPLLKYAVGTDTDNPACSGSEQPVCGERLPSQISLLEALTVVNGTVSPSFASEIFAYDAAVAFDATGLELHTTASGASLHIRSDAADTEVRGTETAKGVLALKPIGDTVIRITVMEGRKMPTEYRLTVSYDIDDSVAKPSTPVLVVDIAQPITESSTVTVRTINDYSCDSGLMLCEWSYRDAMAHTIELAETELSTDSQQISFIAPTDYVELGQMTGPLIVSFTASNRSGVASAEATLVIMRQDNGPLDEETVDPPTLIGRILNAPVIDLAADPDGVNTNPELRYQWQRAKSVVVDLGEPTNWEDIDGATAATYTLTDLSYIPPHRVQLRYTDAQGYENTIYTQWFADIDADDDGLIEIMYLEEVDAIRYQPDGSGYAISTSTAKIAVGCVDGGCAGYELLRDLDFMDDASYISTANKTLWTVADDTNSEDTGWRPISTYINAFNAIFEGNNHSISNLGINLPDGVFVGLFSYIGSSATLANLGVLNASIKGNINVGGLVGWALLSNITNSYVTGTVQGHTRVGGLAGGIDESSIANSYAAGTVTATGSNVGGLVGFGGGNIINSYAAAAVIGMGRNVGGLAGWNLDNITNSYATGTVMGMSTNVGGLVGFNGGSIINSYATASVTGMSSNVGGLIGWNLDNIRNNYAVGTVTGAGNNVGGLIGRGLRRSATNSYWDVQASRIAVSAGGTSKTTIELQSPTTATGIYSGWSTADWDFSSPVHYPLLKYAVGTDPDNPTCGGSEQSACGELLPSQISLLEVLTVANGTVSPPFTPEIFAYDATVAFDIAHLELHTTATGASLHIRSDASDTELRSTETASAVLALKPIGDTVIRITVMEDGKMPTEYRLTVSYTVPPTPVVDGGSMQPLDEGTIVVLRVTDDYPCASDLILCEWNYRDAMHEIELAETELSADSLQLSFTVPTDYVELGQMTRQLIVLFTVRGRGLVLSAETVLVIMGRSDGSIDEETIDPPTLVDRTFTAPMIDLAADPDGVNADPELRYQWQRVKSVVVDLDESANWEDIDGATATTYTLTTVSYIPPHRVQVRYIDAQGYENTIYTQWFIDIDADDDGLIEIIYLEEVDTMRHQLDGSGYISSVGATKIATGCADAGCTGYELLRDLDFMDDASYISAANKTLWTVADYANSEDTGWQPIGTYDDGFSAIFEGNGHTLSNLMLNRSAADYVGLFGYTGSSATLVNLGLLNLSVRGNHYVGGLVAWNQAIIANSYAVGTIAGAGDNAGGLVGVNDKGTIANSYAMGTLAASAKAGALVGWNINSTITNSYATGIIQGDQLIGGLVGVNDQSSIANSYAIGTVIGVGNDVGGLVAQDTEGRITSSYWDVQTSGIAVSAAGTSKTTLDLQSPTAATGIYSEWSTTDWDFSDPSQYPSLQYATASDLSYAACGLSGQTVCGTRLPDQFPERSLLEDLVVVDGTLSPSFKPRLFAYDAMVAIDATHLELQTTAIGASLRIHSDALDTEVRSTDTARVAILLNKEDDTVIRIKVVKDEYRAEMYRLTVPSVAKPSTPVLVVDSGQAITEGDTMIVRVIDASRCGVDLSCSWSHRDATARTIELAEAALSADLPQLGFIVPTDYVESGQTTRQLIVLFTASNRSGIVSVETVLVVMGRSNGSIDEGTVDPPTLIGRTFNAPVIDLAADPDGVNADPELRYQWQRVKSVVVDLDEPANWEDIDGATATTYTLTAVSYIPPHRVRMRYTDAQGYENTVYTQWFIDIDADDDRLIEIMYIEEVDAMRYQLDGSAYRENVDATKITTGCAAGGCIGYELLRDLDFMSDASYISAANKTLWTVADYANSEDTGWQPIGTDDDGFSAIFEGNGHTLSNLMLNRSAADYVGLFGYAGSSATLVNLGLLNLSVRGNSYVGGLVAWNQAIIANSYAVGTIVGASDNVGGLVGVNDKASIANSYAMGTLTASAKAGALVGWNANGTITNSYATGIIQGDQLIGGLVGVNDQSSIANSYAIGTVIGVGNDVGGLVAQDTGARITSSYWDVQTSGIAVSAAGTSKTTLDLQSPTAATGIYSEWSTTDWDFSNPSQYPSLKYATASDLSYAACALSGQPACGEPLPDQFPERSLLEDLVVVDGTLSPPFNPRLFAYDAMLAVDATHLELQTTAIRASLRIHSDALDTGVRSTDTANIAIRLNEEDETVIRIEVVKGEYRAEMYRLTVPPVAKPSTPVLVVDSSQAISEGSTATMRVTNAYRCGVDLICRWSYRDATARTIELADAELSADSLQLSFTAPTDYVELGQTTRQLIVLFTARSRGFVLSAEAALVIVEQNNGSIDEGTVDPPTLIGRAFNAPVIDLAADPDGVSADPELRYQWQSLKSGAVDLGSPDSWEDIDGATSKTYVLSEGAQAIPLRVQIRYTDEQGYENTIYSMPIGDRVVETGVKIRLRVFLEAPL